MARGFRSLRPGLPFLLCCALALGLPARAAAQAGGITGRVTDVATDGPLEAARVVLTGTTRIETTNREGHYTFRGVEPGTYQLRVLRLGYRPETQSVTLAAGETATADFGMTAAPVQLDEIVSTATGEQRKLEVANAISTIDAAAVSELSPITEFTNLISGRAPGVQVLKSGGTTGTGTRIRIRGSNSVSLSNEPLYYIDGVRSESSALSSTLDIGGFGSGIGAGPSRINDLNPDDIEDIEIVKGPAAATLYGIQASNGVVRITTKHGSPGRARWNLFSEVGSVNDNNTYPLNYNGRVDPAVDSLGLDGYCIIPFVLDGSCTQTRVEAYTPLEDKATRPLKAGFRQQHGISVSGGSDVGTYYLSAGYESEDGVFRLPRFEEDSIRQLLGSVPQTQIRPNALERLSLRANLTGNVAKNADVSAELGYVSSNSRFIENDNSFLTITGSGEASGYPSDFNRGWYFIPAELFAEQATQGTERFTGALTGHWRPSGWLTTRATFGYDVVNRNDVQFFPTGQVADYLDNRAGALTDNRFQISQTTVDLGATARFQLSPAVGSKTSVGGQFFRDLASGTFASGRGLIAGSETITGAANTTSASSTVESRSAGAYVEEEIALKERLFVTGALRFDDNSAFGKDFNATTYPKASVSWLMSDEPFFHSSFVNTLRLRGAIGVSGQQPGTTDALRFFNPTTGRKEGAAIAGVTAGNLGNPNLKPERSREFEVGADAGFLKDRVTVELTYYNKRTRDALILRPVAGSLGSTGSQFFNLGRVKNTGWEIAIDTRIIDKPSFAWDVTLSGSATKNRVQELGAGVDEIDVGFYQQHRVGYPLGGFWSRRLLGFNDANGDGIIDASEFTVSDTLEFRGNALPTKEASLNTAFTLFHGRIRLGGQMDYRGGHLVDNSIENFRCTPVLNCRGLVDPTAPLEEQAKAEAVYNVGANEFAFLEPGWFIKLRELSLTFFAPDKWARAFRADRLSLTLAGRNLATITDYSGVDPEVNAFGQENFASSDFESQPQVTYWTARLNIGF